MDPRTHRARRSSRGFTILEAVIALTVMLIGIVGTLSTVLYGTMSDRASRSQTLATGVAEELMGALLALPPTDPHLTVNVASGTTPSTFGPLLSGTGSVTSSGAHVWSDSSPIAGVRTDAQLQGDAEKPLQVERRWVVWDYTPPGMPGGSIVRLISVSVIYRDPMRREVVLYGERTDFGALVVRVFTAG